MDTKNGSFGKFKEDLGEEFYFPIEDIRDDRQVSEWEIDNRVEASTAGRYWGNINVVDRFTG
jgi:hypothetical protein